LKCDVFFGDILSKYIPEELVVEPLVAQLLLDEDEPVEGVLGCPAQKNYSP